MKLGLRWKLFLYAIAVSLAVLIPGGLYLQRELRATLTERIERELETELHAARILFESSNASTPAEIDRLADRLGAALGARVTVIARDGRLLGDTDVTLEELASVESHAGRPEVRAAHERGAGTARRRSTTVDVDLLYKAEPFGDGSRVVRIARRLDEISGAVARLRWLLLVAAGITLAAAVALSAGASRLLSRTLRDVVATATNLAESGGEPDQLAASARDIEHTVGTLALERARFAAVLEGMADGVVALDPAGRVTLMNRGAHELFGAGDDFTGRSLLEVVRVPALDELVSGDGEKGEIEVEVPATRRRVRARRAVQPGGGTILVMQDVTTLHRLENIRRDFVANVSHELRTPVSVIQANAETLAAGALGDAANAPALVGAIHRNAERLADLIEDLLDLSRLEAGQYRVDIEPVDVGAAAQRVVEALERVAAQRGTIIEVAVGPDVVAAADAGALHQVLVNVVTNAIVHTPEKSRVTIDARVLADGGVRIEVADDGPGIPAGQRERIFERFYRIDPGRSRAMGGTGLGLSIVKHMVDAMGGQVGVRDNTPRGALFWIDLPPANT
ncbi:MAG TPA: ATP-binding protein [Kofleriaceae bacterium]|nr:ATP-binding protein [Kofleriaceae bacterium]